MSLDSAILKIQKLIEQLEMQTGVPAEPKPVEAKPQKPAKEQKPELPVNIANFSKCDIRVTQVKTCERVQDSEKLLKMTLDIGNNETRLFAAGVAQYYTPEEMVGKKIVTILNLPPRPMCNKTITSEAMLFAGSYGEEANRVVKLCFPDQSVPVGSRVVPVGFEIPEAEGSAKKVFDKVVDLLKAKDKEMAMEGIKLVAGGKPIAVDVPDDSHLG